MILLSRHLRPPISSYWHLLQQMLFLRHFYSIFPVLIISGKISGILFLYSFVFCCTENFQCRCIRHPLHPVYNHSTISVLRSGLFYPTFPNHPSTLKHLLPSPFKLLSEPHSTLNPLLPSHRRILSPSQSAGFTKTSPTQKAKSSCLLNVVW